MKQMLDSLELKDIADQVQKKVEKLSKQTNDDKALRELGEIHKLVSLIRIN